MTIKKYKTFVEGSKKKYNVSLDNTNWTYKINSLKGKYTSSTTIKKKNFNCVIILNKNHVIIVSNKITRYNFKRGDELKEITKIDHTLYKGVLYVTIMTKRYVYDMMYKRLVDKKDYDRYDPNGTVRYSDFVKKYPKL